jgi:excinuclease UvrABC ATPase subunit
LTAQITVRGARLHNLKNITLTIPKNQLVVLTGLSGSGKSTLGFDILNKEGQRQYLESLGLVTFGVSKPPVDSITGLSPSISLDQHLTNHSPRSTLSGGEAQRVKLAKELGRRVTGRTLYLLDEPTTGLHLADTARLLGVLQRLVDAGNTVLVVEHNLELVKAADWVIDLGPEGGAAGGKLIAQGTPEQVAEAPGSYTGQCLRDILQFSEV